MQYVYIAAAILLRFAPHPWNITPLGGMFLFGGASFDKKAHSLIVPLVGLIISDIAIVELFYKGNYAWFSPFTWLGFLSIGLIGWSLRRKFTTGRLIAASFIGSLSFFIISNFGVWAEGILYPRNLAGLMKCYIAGLPFFRNSLIGDLFYSTIMFYSYRWLMHQLPESFQPSIEK